MFWLPEAGSPKFHDHDVGPFVDWSVNATVNGATPLVGLAEKAPTGTPAGVDVGVEVGVDVGVPPVTITRRGGLLLSPDEKIAELFPTLFSAKETRPFPEMADVGSAMSR